MQLNELDKLIEEYIEENDMVSVVRCKDCKYLAEIIEGDNEIFCVYTRAYFFKNSFCSYGERKNNNEN